jgi:hypothetical protein
MDVSLEGMNGTNKGTTTASYVEAAVFQGYGGINGKTIIHITNLSGATTTMYYKVDGYLSAHPDCTAVAVTAETDVVNATKVVDAGADKPYAKIVVSVKNHSGACLYQIDHMTY